MSPKTFRLVSLGQLDLLDADGVSADPGLSVRRRKLALLVVLAAARRPVSKDSLLEMFWGDQDATRARHSLSDALSHLRRVLGRHAIAANQSTAALDLTAALAVDTVEFANAVKAGNDARALELYCGPFLDGVHVDGSASFEQWVSAERHRLDVLFARASARQSAALLASEHFEELADVARRWLELEPASSEAARYRVTALAGPGTREARVRALQEFERIGSRLQADFGLRPEASLVELARTLSRQVRENEPPRGTTAEFSVPAHLLPTTADAKGGASGAPASAGVRAVPPSRTDESPASSAVAPGRPSDRATAGDGPPASAAEPAGVEPAGTAGATDAPGGAVSAARTSGPATAPWWKPRRRAGVAVSMAVLAAVVGAVVFTRRNAPLAEAGGHTVVALTDFQFTRQSDTTQSWMAEGLAAMLASRLSRSNALELISPERVREIANRAHYNLREPLGTERSREIGVQAGANWVVSGAMSKADTLLQLELTVRDVASGKVLRVSSVAARDVLSLADAAAARLLDVVDPAGGGARLTDLETSSQEAYQHFVAYVRYSTGVSFTRAIQELDQALALDSGFISAIIERRNYARSIGDNVVAARLDTLFRKHEARASFWDRTTLEAERILPQGEVGRTLALYRELVARYPRDPRGYTRLWGILTVNGEWEEAAVVARQQLAIDSLAATSGNGVCAPCGAYSDLATTYLALGNVGAAEDAARRLLALQPDLGGGWALYAGVLLAAGKYDEGLEAFRRARVLNPEGADGWQNMYGRFLIIAERLADADTVAAALERSTNKAARLDGLDIRALWWREKGQWQKALAAIDQMEREGGDKRQARLMRGNTLARMGDYAGARRAFESLHELYQHDVRGEAARFFAWSHTLEGDALAPAGDTLLLKMLADSVFLVGSNSYYARDKMVPHYLRGLVAVRGGRPAEAEKEFRLALFTRNGFTRVNMELSRLLMKQRRYAAAESLLVAALMGPLDAMPRYQPRSEVHALLDTLRAQMKGTTATTASGVERR